MVFLALGLVEASGLLRMHFKCCAGCGGALAGG